MNVLKGKWVYKVKLRLEEQVLHYKSCWVIKGYIQKYSIDFDETWAGVVNIMTIHIILALAALLDLEIE